MVSRRRYRLNQFWTDFDEMMADMEDRFMSMLSGVNRLPARVSEGITALPALPSFRGDLRLDVRDHDNEVIVVADLPGVEKEDVRVKLMSPNLLMIFCERKAETEENEEGYYMRERSYGSMSRSVPLPADVTEEGTTASFKNGVLEVHLKKLPGGEGRDITIE
ncbi:MAG: Hsp20/alpha crystallin family protein [Methanomicrobiaceae archaeon]|nr:Hsp20/alpha crystallin family protein [Methanomicrobiaceae archaeon]